MIKANERTNEQNNNSTVSICRTVFTLLVIIMQRQYIESTEKNQQNKTKAYITTYQNAGSASKQNVPADSKEAPIKNKLPIKLLPVKLQTQKSTRFANKPIPAKIGAIKTQNWDVANDG